MKKYSKILTGIGMGASLITVPAVIGYILYFIKFIAAEILEQAPRALFYKDFGTKTLEGAKYILESPSKFATTFRITEEELPKRLEELKEVIATCEALPGILNNIVSVATIIGIVIGAAFILCAFVFGALALIKGRKGRQLPKWLKIVVAIFVSPVAGMNELYGAKEAASKLLMVSAAFYGVFAVTILVQNIFVDVNLMHYFLELVFNVKTTTIFGSANSLLPGLVAFGFPVLAICMAFCVRTRLRYNELNTLWKIFAILFVWPTIGVLTVLIPKNESHSTRVTDTFGDKVLNLLTSLVLFAIIFIVGYPILFVISSAFTSSEALSAGLVAVWPVDVSLEAFEFVMQYKDVWTGFRNSVFYTVCDVFLQMTMTILVAYPLSRRSFQGRSIYTMIFYMSTRISAGMIPSFILKCDLGLFDNIWAVLISGSVSVSHILILRTCFQTAIPGELFDSAMIDGANHFKCVTKIALPLAKATLSVLILYCIVGQWNEYFTSMLYLRKKALYPLQLILRPIMQAATSVGSSMDVSSMNAAAQSQAQSGLENVRYALIVISSAPVIAAYFVVQKYFKGGVMLGSVKG